MFNPKTAADSSDAGYRRGKEKKKKKKKDWHHGQIARKRPKGEDGGVVVYARSNEK